MTYIYIYIYTYIYWYENVILSFCVAVFTLISTLLYQELKMNIILYID